MLKYLQRWQVLGVFGVFALGTSGCDFIDGFFDGDEGEAEGETVNVSLVEFAVYPDPGSASEGTVTFHVSNDGTEPHEFLVVMTDLADDSLPTNPDGTYEEDGTGTELIDEIEVIYPGWSEDLTLDLDAANYVLLCNMFDKEEDEAHYSLGMHAPFVVE